MRRRTIVVIEDEATIAGAVAARLRSEGFRVEVAGTGPEGVQLCRRLAPDLVVLDWMLPGFDGIEACRRIQADGPVAVLFLTARDAEADVLVGLGIGADDYVTKPFSQRELVARVHAILRRCDRAPAADAPARIMLGEHLLDVEGRRVLHDGIEVALTPTELDLLVALAARPGRAFTREELLGEVWEWRSGGSTRTVAHAADAMARGDHSQRVAVGSRDEVGQLADAFNHILAGCGAGVDAEIVPPGLRARGDPERLRQVVANLVDNAHRHARRVPRFASVPTQARRADCASRSRIADRDSPPPTPSASSTASPAPTARARWPDRVWGWRSCARSSSCTAGPSAPSPSRRRAVAWSSTCRSRRRPSS